MKKSLLILTVTLFAVCLIFIGMQKGSFYRSTLGLISQNYENNNGEISQGNKPFLKVDNDNFIQWDAKHYKLIGSFGYDVKKAGGDYIFAFFPLFPLFWKLSQLPPIGILFLNFLFFSISVLIFLKLFLPQANYLYNLLIVLTLPSLIIFLLPYSEATFLLMVSVGVHGLVKGKYWVYFAGFALASMARPTYTFLILSIICTEVYFYFSYKKWTKTILNIGIRIAPLVIGALIVSVIQVKQGSGSWVKFIEVQKYWGHTFSLPHNIRDWSHEGFAINIGELVLVFFPFIAVVLFKLGRGFKGITLVKSNNYDDARTYLIVMSVFYLVGINLFILFFQDGSLHNLFRYTLSTPFFLILLFCLPFYLNQYSNRVKGYVFGGLVLLATIALSLIPYSHNWNFSDFGFFIFAQSLFYWLFQSYTTNKYYRIGLSLSLLFNITWTAYLLNVYINNGWIFA